MNPTTLTSQMYSGLRDGEITLLLETNGEKIKALKDFKAPNSRDEAVGLLIRAGIEPPAVTESRYRVDVGDGNFYASQFGLDFRAGVAWTDDPRAAHACLEIGKNVKVIDTVTGKAPRFAGPADGNRAADGGRAADSNRGADQAAKN